MRKVNAHGASTSANVLGPSTTPNLAGEYPLVTFPAPRSRRDITRAKNPDGTDIVGPKKRVRGPRTLPSDSSTVSVGRRRKTKATVGEVPDGSAAPAKKVQVITSEGISQYTNACSTLIGLCREHCVIYHA
ncbi:hypothetical protein Hypma_008530 [Hypsizygus marmoreus]|uniref:Uncharacterized protein n=1 Tax=Hypsizygus marmoreus TaxID=39966 RepID=A0A369JVS8_HYPMA|nr:hypothetical protein Hypma_008530 [Hypsizygus marmoreus]